MQAPPPSGPHPLRTLREAGAGLDLVRLIVRWPELASHPRGAGEPVIVLPGFAAGDASTWILRRHLRRLGYRVSGWGLGINRGDVRRLVGETGRLVAERVCETNEKVRLVGWSLGGVVAREVARERPDLVDRVVTLGSPVVGGPRYTVTARFFDGSEEDLDAIERSIAARERRPIQVPVTALYSEEDGIVDWRACIDRTNPRVEHVRVRATHMGLGFAPEVLALVADRLAARLD